MPGDPEWDAVLEGLEQDRRELEARDPELSAAHRYHEQLQREIEQEDEELREHLERHGDPQLTGQDIQYTGHGRFDWVPGAYRRYMLRYVYENEGVIPPPFVEFPMTTQYQFGRGIADMVDNTGPGCQPGLELGDE